MPASQLLQPERMGSARALLYLARPWNVARAGSPSDGWALIIDPCSPFRVLPPLGKWEISDPAEGSKAHSEQLKLGHPERAAQGPGSGGQAVGPWSVGFTWVGPSLSWEGGEWTGSGRAEQLVASKATCCLPCKLCTGEGDRLATPSFLEHCLLSTLDASSTPGVTVLFAILLPFYPLLRVQFHALEDFHCLGDRHHCLLQYFSSSQTEALSSLDTNSTTSPSSQAPAPTFCPPSLQMGLLRGPRVTGPTQHLSYVWLISLSIVSSRFCAVEGVGTSSFVKAQYYLIVELDHTLLIQPSINGHLGSPPFDYREHTATNAGEQTSVESLLPVHSNVFPKADLLGHLPVLHMTFGATALSFLQQLPAYSPIPAHS